MEKRSRGRTRVKPMSINQLTTVIEAVPEPMLYLDSDGVIEAANAGARALLGAWIQGRSYAAVLRQPAVLGRIETVQADGQTFEAGAAYTVPLDQPQGRFVKAALERISTYQDSVFYDVSTWTLPLAFGVEGRQGPALRRLTRLLFALRAYVERDGGARSEAAEAAFLESAVASPTPMLMTIFSSRAGSCGFLYPYFSVRAGLIFESYLSLKRGFIFSHLIQPSRRTFWPRGPSCRL